MSGRRAGWLAATLVLSVGCANAPSAGLVGAWELTRMNGAAPRRPADLRLGPSTFSGAAFCNEYGGDYAVRGGRLIVGAVHVTQRACVDLLGGRRADPMAAEGAFLQILQSGPAIRVSATSLVLEGAGGTLEFRPRETAPTR